jgi:DNA-binding winged helix-turn-helix (wHTH) protein
MAIVVFDSFQLDTRSLELRKDGARVPLRPQPCRMLALLASQPGRLVTRDEIRHLIWPSVLFVRFDLGVNSCLKQIRRALGDRAHSPRYIETLNGRGYRFMPKVLVQAEPAGVPRRRLTVLPFHGGDDMEQRLADGLGADLTRLLATERDSPIVVVDPLVLNGATTPVSAVEAMRAQGVELLLHGRVHAADGRVRVSSSLMATRDFAHVWADLFDSPLSKGLGLPEHMASEISLAVTAACMRMPPAEPPARMAMTRRLVAS